MADFDRTNTGVLFKNDKKQEGDRKPEYTGNVNIDGKEFWLSAWIKEGQRGKFMSLSVQPKEAQAAVSNGGGKPASYKDALDGDDIPFAAEFR